ncbi:MAG: hypothetical protein IJG13_12485 [Kiritimatiellae bacterium]|nr:hypothetical protein [Kiritimatiellia bacterium]MBQ6328557.1 hypothetical protein [Kiritimatiellia bacterium]
MSGIHTSVLRERHPYTRSESPWILREHASVYGKLIHYLAGGGMEAFGRTVKQEEVLRRQRRFLSVAGLLAVGWLALLVF